MGDGATPPHSRLFTPGPTELPQAVYRALATPLSPPRGPAFMARLARVGKRLGEVFATAGPVLTLTASGTGAMEAALVNLARRGEPVLVCHAGKFGERWREIAAAHDVRHHVLERPWGERVTPPALDAALAAHPDVAVVLLTHSETSTGVVHDVEALAAAVRARSRALVVVDAVSSAGALPLRMDAWGIDACVAAAHKGFLCPPGLAFVALGPRGVAAVAAADRPRYYLDLRPALAGAADGGTPWTPAVSLVHALEAGLECLLRDGLPAAWARTARLAAATRAAVAAQGLALFAQPPGDAVTAVRAPAAVDARRVVAGLRERGFEIAGGQDRIKREVFRIAHLGAIRDADLLDLTQALDAVLTDLGAAPPSPGAARAAAAAVLDAAGGGVEDRRA